MGLFEIVGNSDKKVWESYFVRRNFLLGDEVNVLHKGIIYSGKIIEKEFDNWGDPWVTVKTKNKVKNSEGLLGGFGLFYPVTGRNEIYFAHEPLPGGDPIYEKKIEWEMTDEEIKRNNEPLPF